jgi:hypothetical protein
MYYQFVKADLELNSPRNFSLVNSTDTGTEPNEDRRGCDEESVAGEAVCDRLETGSEVQGSKVLRLTVEITLNGER